MASPAQAVWRVAQVVQALRQTFGSIDQTSLPEEGLKQLVIATFAARDQMLQPFEHTRDSSLFQQAVFAKLGMNYVRPPGPRSMIVASVASEATGQPRDSNKRKSMSTPAHDHVHGPPAGVSATGGIEMFANRSSVLADRVLVPHASTWHKLQMSDAASPVISTARGKGKGNAGGGTTPVRVPEPTPAEEAMHDAADPSASFP